MKQGTLEIRTRTKSPVYTLRLAPGLAGKIAETRERLGLKNDQEAISYLLTWAVEQRAAQAAVVQMSDAMKRMEADFPQLAEAATRSRKAKK